MKKLLLFLVTTVILISCIGPIGPPGRDGQDGVNILGQVFEAQLSFTTANDFQELVVFPNQVEVFDTDVVLAYILVGVDNGVDIWEPLPQTLYFEDGILLYGYNYTFQDIVFFLDGTVFFEDLLPEFTQDLVFRIAIIPADLAGSIDTNSLTNVLSSIQNKEIIKLD